MKERELDIRSAKVKVPLYFKVFFTEFMTLRSVAIVFQNTCCLPPLDTLI